MGNIFLFAKISIFWGCLKVMIILGVNGRCWAWAYTWRKNDSTSATPPAPPPPRNVAHICARSWRYRSATGLNRTSIVSNPGVIVSIRSSTVVNCSAAVMSHSGSVDKSRRHHRTIVKHCIDAWFSFFLIPMHPYFTIWLKLEVNHGKSCPESWLCNWGFTEKVLTESLRISLNKHKNICFPVPPCELTVLVFWQQQNLVRSFDQ